MLTDSEYRNLSRTQQRWHALLYNVWDITRNAETARGDVDGPGLEQVGLEECISNNKLEHFNHIWSLGWAGWRSAWLGLSPATLICGLSMWPRPLSAERVSSEKQHLWKKQGSQKTTLGRHKVPVFLKGKEQSQVCPDSRENSSLVLDERNAKELGAMFKNHHMTLYKTKSELGTGL